VSQVHSLIGDYHTGLQCLFPLNIFDKTHLYTPLISSCHITLFYYSSFAFIMLQRYTDAGRYVARTVSSLFSCAFILGFFLGGGRDTIAYLTLLLSVVLVRLANLQLGLSLLPLPLLLLMLYVCVWQLTVVRCDV
jgi:hypothetical protein